MTKISRFTSPSALASPLVTKCALAASGLALVGLVDCSKSGGNTASAPAPVPSAGADNSLVNPVSTSKPSATPDAPRDVTVTAPTATSLTVSWTSASTGLTGFVVQRSPDGLTNWKPIVTTAPTANSILDTSVVPNTTYYYQVAAINGSNTSAQSTAAQGKTSVDGKTPVPTAASGLTVGNATSNALTLSWTRTSSNEAGFLIERSLDGSTNWQIVTTTATGVVTYTDSTLSAGTKYFYRVSATSAGGTATPTAVMSSTTLGASTSTGPVGLIPSPTEPPQPVNFADVPMAADYDGVGKADLAVYRMELGQWIINHQDGTRDTFPFGHPVVDIPVTGDFDGDGKADVGVYNSQTGTWNIIQSSNKTVLNVPWGAAGDIPVPGDYDGIHKTEIAVYRPSTGEFIIRAATPRSVKIGVPYIDVPEQADYDGDGKTDPAVYNPQSGKWTILMSQGGSTTPLTRLFGAPYTDIPIPGDYDGDGKADVAIWRPSTGQWCVLPSKAPTDQPCQVFSGTAPLMHPVPAIYGGARKYQFATFNVKTTEWVIQNPDGSLNVQLFGNAGAYRDPYQSPFLIAGMTSYLPFAAIFFQK